TWELAVVRPDRRLFAGQDLELDRLRLEIHLEHVRVRVEVLRGRDLQILVPARRLRDSARALERRRGGGAVRRGRAALAARARAEGEDREQCSKPSGETNHSTLEEPCSLITRYGPRRARGIRRTTIGALVQARSGVRRGVGIGLRARRRGRCARLRDPLAEWHALDNS